VAVFCHERLDESRHVTFENNFLALPAGEKVEVPAASHEDAGGLDVSARSQR
jgi:hypothetical protein